MEKGVSGKLNKKMKHTKADDRFFLRDEYEH